MSLSNPRETLERPAKKYIQFNGETGKITYWHKFSKDDPKYSEDNKGERREISIDGAIVLDSDLFSVTGFNKDRGYCFTNEVRNVQDELVLRFFNEKKVDCRGTLEDLKREHGKEVRYTKSAYLFLDGEIVNMQIFGKSLSSWFEDIENRRKDLIKRKIRVKEIRTADEGKKSEHKYLVFEYGPEFSKEEGEAAVEADRELQAYLKKYLEKNGTSTERGQGSHEEHAHGEEESFDTSHWRDFVSDIGSLGDAPMSAIYNQKSVLEDSDRTESEEYAMICQACHDYEKAKREWKSKKDKAGKSLEEYSLDELKDTYGKVMKSDPKNPARLFLEAALVEREEEEESFDEDDIPF